MVLEYRKPDARSTKREKLSQDSLFPPANSSRSFLIFTVTRGRCAASDCRYASIPRTLMGEGGLGLQCGFNSLKAKPRDSGSYMLPGSTELEPRDYLKITREVACDCLAFA